MFDCGFFLFRFQVFFPARGRAVVFPAVSCFGTEKNSIAVESLAVMFCISRVLSVGGRGVYSWEGGSLHVLHTLLLYTTTDDGQQVKWTSERHYFPVETYNSEDCGVCVGGQTRAVAF